MVYVKYDSDTTDVTVAGLARMPLHTDRVSFRKLEITAAHRRDSLHSRRRL